MVTGVDPISGPRAGGGSVTITGSGFTPGSVVKFGPVVAGSVNAQSDSSIVVQVPAGSGTTDVTVQTPGGTSLVSPLDEYTYTFSNPPYAIGITASSLSPGANGSVTLVASANLDVGPTPYGLSIMDVTLGDEVAHAGSGSSISFVATQPRGGTHRYVGLVSNLAGANAQAMSSPVVVTWPGSGTPPPVPVPTPVPTPLPSPSPTPTPTPVPGPPPPVTTNGFAISLTASATSAGVGSPVNLTGTANRDIGPTPYGLSIFDTSTGQELAHVGSGSVIAVSVSQPSVATHSFVAMVCNPGGINSQASSSPVTVTWS